MKRYAVSFMIEIDNDQNPGDWIHESISDQLNYFNENLIDFICEEIEEE